MINDNIGLPNNINLALSDSVSVGPSDGEILVALERRSIGPTADYLKTLREELPRRFPDLEFFTQPADIVSQILNFGLPAPIDIQISGPIGERDELRDRAADRAGAVGRARRGGRARPAGHRRAADHGSTPTGRWRMQSGLTESDIANSLSVSLAGSGTATTNFWLNYRNGVQLPGRRADAAVSRQLDGRAAPHADRRRRPGPAAAAEQPGDVQPGDHAAVAEPLQRAAGLRRARQRAGHRSRQRRRMRSTGSSPSTAAQISKASTITVRGQVQSMKQAFCRIGARDRLCGAARVFPDGRQLPVLARSVHHPDGAARRAGGHSLGAVRHRHDAQRALAHGLHHGDRRRHVEQHPDGHVRQRAAAAGLRRPRCADGRARWPAARGFARC